MLVRDPYTGQLHEVPDYGRPVADPRFGHAPGLSEYEMGETVYDGLGNPVGVLPFIPLIAKALPAIAKTVLPMVSKILPQAGGAISSVLSPGGAPAGPPEPAPLPPAPMPPEPMPVAPVAPQPPPGGVVPAPFPPPGPGGPVFARRRLYRRRRTYGR